MTKQELEAHLDILRITPAEAAQLLGISTRSLQRWSEGEEVPAPAASALRAWRILAEHHIPWMPDAGTIFNDDQDQIQRHNRHSEELAELLNEVEKRGGAKNRWTVDIAKGRATFGPFIITFYRLQSGSFSPAYCRRLDMPFNRVRDSSDVQDAYYCIAQAFSNIPRVHEALSDVAKYIRSNSDSFARRGSSLLTTEKLAHHRRLIAAQADRIEAQAKSSLEGAVDYAQFEATLSELHSLGFFPEISLISRVAKYMN